jgi:hypothetical protein
MPDLPEITVYGPRPSTVILDDHIVRIIPLPQSNPPPAVAISATVTIIGDAMTPTSTITVDTTTGTAVLEFVDDHGDTDAAAPDGAQAQWSSDNTAVATIVNAADNPLNGDITPVAEGTTNISVALTDASGNPLTLPDGTVFPTPAPVALTVGAGNAISAAVVTED